MDADEVGKGTQNYASSEWKEWRSNRGSENFKEGNIPAWKDSVITVTKSVKPLRKRFKNDANRSIFFSALLRMVFVSNWAFM